jgi:GntR family transcriptional regulator/MocR family aminotransferase
MEPVLSLALDLPARGQGNRVRALHQQLRAAILDGRLAANSALPATRQVAEALGIARNTVIAAYDLLIAEGYALPRSGSTARVADIAARRPAKSAAKAVPLRDTRIAERWRLPVPGDPPRTGLPERSFRLGIPDHRYFPHETWRRLSAQSLREWARAPFAYPPSEGIPELRAAIARHAAFARAVACASDDVVVTSGAQQAFDLLARLLVTAGKTRVAFEEPSYPPARAAFLAAGALLVPVPVDDEGLRVDQLPDDVAIVCVTPSHQSPTGVALSLRRRSALLAFARARNAVILEDDYDGEFRFGGRPLDALQTLDRDGRVFYVGTFSKSLFPALRKGFIVAPAWAREALVRVKQCADSHCDTVTQSVLAAFIRDGHLARHVRRMRPIYAARREALLEGIRRELGPWLEPIPSEAGLHLAARIRQPKLAQAILAKARQHLPGSQSTQEYAHGPQVPPALTIGYGVIDAEAIPAALRRLRRALEKWDGGN